MRGVPGPAGLDVETRQGAGATPRAADGRAPRRSRRTSRRRRRAAPSPGGPHMPAPTMHPGRTFAPPDLLLRTQLEPACVQIPAIWGGCIHVTGVAARRARRGPPLKDTRGSAGAHAPAGVLAGLSDGDEAPVAHRFAGDHDFAPERMGSPKGPQICRRTDSPDPLVYQLSNGHRRQPAERGARAGTPCREQRREPARGPRPRRRRLAPGPAPRGHGPAVAVFDGDHQAPRARGRLPRAAAVGRRQEIPLEQRAGVVVARHRPGAGGRGKEAPSARPMKPPRPTDGGNLRKAREREQARGGPAPRAAPARRDRAGSSGIGAVDEQEPQDAEGSGSSGWNRPDRGRRSGGWPGPR